MIARVWCWLTHWRSWIDEPVAHGWWMRQCLICDRVWTVED